MSPAATNRKPEAYAALNKPAATPHRLQLVEKDPRAAQEAREQRIMSFLQRISFDAYQSKTSAVRREKIMKVLAWSARRYKKGTDLHMVAGYANDRAASTLTYMAAHVTAG